MFQSTRPRGARPIALQMEWCKSRFQSTRPRGARRWALPFRTLSGVSIHAPARGATLIPREYLIPDEFQSTRPRGARLLLGQNNLRGVCFNPRAREGRDPALSQCPRYHRGFQSTRPRGARLLCSNLLHFKQIKDIFREH